MQHRFTEEYLKISIGFLLVVIALGTIVPTSRANVQENAGNRLQYRDGDILLAGLMRVHKREGEFCSEIQEDGIQAVETMNMIIDQINANKTLLPGVKLGTIMVDTCDVDSHALQRVVLDILPLIWNVSIKSTTSVDRPVVKSSLIAGVVGSASSAVSIQVANLLRVFAIPQVSYWSTSPDLSNKARYQYFFRTVPSDTNQASAMIAVVKKLQWSYVSVVYEDDFYGVRGFTEVKKIAKVNGICIAVSQAVPRTPTTNDFINIMEQLLTKPEAKAVIVFTKRNDAADLMLAAQSLGASDSFVWLGSDGWSGQIPQSESNNLRDEVVDGALGFTPKTSQLEDLPEYFTSLTLGQHVGANASRNPWFGEYISQKKHCNIAAGSNFSRNCLANEAIDLDSFEPLTKMQSVADAVLSFAYALDDYHRNACQGKPGMCNAISELSGTNKLASGLYNYLKNITFTGINGGIVTFNEDQDGPAVYNILNYQKEINSRGSRLGKWISAGTYDSGNISWHTTLSEKVATSESVCSTPCESGYAKIMENDNCCWHCQLCRSNEYVAGNASVCLQCERGEKPDANMTGCVPLIIQDMSYGSTYGISCLAIGVFGLVCTVMVVCIYTKFRDTAIVKASGRELCFFVLFGVFLTFCNCFSMTTAASIPSCITSRIILSIGPTFMYAGLLTKTIRVVIIFQSKILSQRVKTFLRPVPQLSFALTLVLIQAIVSTVWFSISTAEVTKLYPSIDVVFRACKNLVDIPILIGLIYPFILIMICTVLATINRNVPTGFNETQYIGFSMYTTCVIWLAFLPIFITNSSDIPQRIMTTSVCLSLSATTVLLCLFGPRCFNILFHPEINTQQSVMTTASVNVDRGGVPGSKSIAPISTLSPKKVNNSKTNTMENNNLNKKTSQTSANKSDSQNEDISNDKSGNLEASSKQNGYDNMALSSCPSVANITGQNSSDKNAAQTNSRDVNKAESATRL